MSLTGGSKFILTGGANYQIARSLRFRSSASANLSRTPAGAGNRKTFTFSCWYKRSEVGASATTNDTLFSCGTTTTNSYSVIGFNQVYGTDAALTYYSVNGSTVLDHTRYSTAAFRDPSAPLHVVVSIDTTQATAQNRARMYVNGVELTSFSSNTSIAQNTDTMMNRASQHNIGAVLYNNALVNFCVGYMSDVYFVDGQQLTPSSFGQTDATTGAWNPIKYIGTYGTNGFYLPFSDNSAATSTTIGKDSSGNGNNWTPSGISVTAGVTNDSLVDTPTNYGTDTGAGGEVRGNYCTLNPLRNGGLTLSNGNLGYAASGNNHACLGTFGMVGGKWRWSVKSNTTAGVLGITDDVSALTYVGSDTHGWGYSSSGLFVTNATTFGSPASWTTGDVIDFVLDLTIGAGSNTLKAYKNGSLQGTLSSTLGNGPFFPAVSDNGGGTGAGDCNFGQRAWDYSNATLGVSGFMALCTHNLPNPVIVKPSSYMDVNLRGGTGNAGSVTGKGFQPDFVWSKSRSPRSHMLADSVRGTGKYQSSDSTAVEVSDAQAVTAFNSDGFSFGTSAILNTNAENFVDWMWRGGGAAVTNGAGSISAQVSANVLAGISLATFTGTGANATVGHGLGVAPSLAIVKSRGTAGNGWGTYHSSVGAGSYLLLNSTAAAVAFAAAWNSTAPNSTVVSLGSNGSFNDSGNGMVMYAFAEVAGFSKFGSYTGNGSADGPFVWCGFRPRWILVKNTTSAYSWQLYDTARDTYNPMSGELDPNASVAEGPFVMFDALSNGFKMRTTDATTNASGSNYIFMAFAEAPFKTARAR